ncbi:MAG TPA: chromosome segregation protein SMC [Candidatus Methylacidiphilales bacterium]|jgi:chromosome segregation protein|nr:chromosome segregation protein SMC [Candidatus Methylacidiphilales bacterium]
MYLKSLNVVGFKSFADRTTLEFHPGVTAIVGPNGCGKSNVLDSIRWVLGEQSAKALRGGEMKDVIFSGTEARPPLGMAEVSLTFGDCEKDLGTAYNEVTITRRVFRDGASEYELNKTPCRLRDIHGLFMDTGIGRSAYSIMEQGKIDTILSSRPEDRRAIFEEAAGITKFKSQKKEALRKLENTDANLVRLADIIREVKRQIGSLQRQAGKARRYQAGFEELSRVESRWGRHQFDTFSATISALQSEVDGARERQERLHADVSGQEEKVSSARGHLAVVEAELLRLREEQAAIRNALERAEQRAATNRARVEEFTGLRDQARQEIAGTEEKVRVGEEQLAHLDSQVDHFTRLRDETRRRFDGEQEALQTLTARIEGVEAGRAEIEEEKLRQEQLHHRQEQELAGLELQQRNFQLRVEALQSEQAALAQRRDQAQAAVTRHASLLTQAETLLRERREALQQAQQARSEAEEKLREADKSRNEIAGTHHRLQARRDALAQLEGEHASAPQAAQRLLKAQVAGELQGTLSAHITVNPGYEAPLALLLGDAVNALILNDSVAAQSWREKLEEKEQCAFAPLSAARPTPLPSSAATHASRFLTARPLVGDLVAALLEDAHVVDDLAAGWKLKAAQPQSVIATRAGELITRSGLLLVGQEAGASLAVLTRQSELRGLEAELAASSAKVAGAQADVDAVRRVLEDKTNLVEQARAAVQETEISVATQRQEERAAQSAAAQVVRQAEDAAREMTRLNTQEQADHERHERLREAMADAASARREAEARIEEFQGQLDELASEEQTRTNALTESRIELATQTQQCDAWRQQREPVAGRLRELRELVALRTRESHEHERRVVQAREEISSAEREHAGKNAAQARVAGELDLALTRRSAAQAKIDDQENVLRALRREHGEIQSARSENEVKLAEQKLFLANLREKFHRDYHRELEDLPPLADAATDWAAVEAEVASRRAALDAIGPVNLEAITEYDELEQRHKFLTGQEADLLAAREQILKAIQEINRTTQKLFAETFEQVKVNFQEMFSELFGGGKATLALMDESDPLECGIDIIAKPPGKQTQTVSLLSGGERTMTAVALLFAIYMVKPSPFCVLDELDAPLDESNINRFIKILQRFVKQSQFVVITHNKRTISIVDVLYGVTMEERGVSKFVSLRLHKRDATAQANGNGAHAEEEHAPSIAESIGKG